MVLLPVLLPVPVHDSINRSRRNRCVCEFASMGWPWPAHEFFLSARSRHRRYIVTWKDGRDGYQFPDAPVEYGTDTHPTATGRKKAEETEPGRENSIEPIASHTANPTPATRPRGTQSPLRVFLHGTSDIFARINL